MDQVERQGEQERRSERAAASPEKVRWRHRCEAVAALVLVPAGIALVGVAIVRGFPVLVVPVVLIGVAVATLWLALVHPRPRRYVYVVLTVLALAGAVVALVVLDAALVFLAVGVVLVAVGIVSARAARRGASTPRGRRVARARHPVLIVNPASGGGVAQGSGLLDAARERGIGVVELSEDSDLVALARSAVRDGADCLGMAGGDGSLAPVAEVAMSAGIPFVCIPAGTRNHFALDLGLDRSDPVAALGAFGAAIERRIDVGVVNGQTFLNNVSIGAYGEVVAEEGYREAKVGTALERLPELLGPDSESLDLRFVDGEGVQHDTAHVVHVSNNSYDLAPLPGFGTRPSLTDGRLGIVVLRSAVGAGVRPTVQQWESPTFEVRSGAPVAAGVDGEATTLDAPVRFELRRAALRVRIPADAVGASPSAVRPSLTPRSVWRLAGIAAGRPAP